MEDLNNTTSALIEGEIEEPVCGEFGDELLIEELPAFELALLQGCSDATGK